MNRHERCRTENVKLYVSAILARNDIVGEHVKLSRPPRIKFVRLSSLRSAGKIPINWYRGSLGALG